MYVILNIEQNFSLDFFPTLLLILTKHDHKPTPHFNIGLINTGHTLAFSLSLSHMNLDKFYRN